jgi:hypothetical protein
LDGGSAHWALTSLPDPKHATVQVRTLNEEEVKEEENKRKEM